MALKRCPSFPGYSVDKKCNVYTHKKRRRILGKKGGTENYIDYSTYRKIPQHLTQNGYLVVHAQRKGDNYRNYFVHQLVTDAFLGPIPENMEVRHLNGVKTDNFPENLAYGTRQDNADDRKRQGKYYKGENHHNSKLTMKQVKQIRKLRKEKIKIKYLAERFKVSIPTIESIVYNKTYL
jgi:hypothetical protein